MILSGSRTTAKLFHVGSLLAAILALAYAEIPFSGGPIGYFLLVGSALGLVYLMIPPPPRPLNDVAGYIFGGLIAVLGSVWIAVRLNLIWMPALPQWIFGKDDLGTIPVQLAIIPCIGPLLPPLLLIKLMVRQLPRDFWVEQSIGLVLICLASVLCSDLLFGVLILGYFLLVMTALAHHELADCESQTAFQLAQADLPPPNWRQRITRWFVISLVASLTVFFLLPRFDLPSWDPLERFSGKRFQAGFSDQVNINEKGQIELSDQLAFTVECKGPNGPGTLLDNQLFRGNYLENYRDGVWSRRTYNFGKPLPMETRVVSPPPGYFQLTFRVEPYRVGGAFLAEPMDMRFDGAEPTTGVVVRKQDRLIPTFLMDGQTVFSNPFISRVKGEVVYQQLIRANSGPPRRAALGRIPLPQLQELTNLDNPEITRYTLQVLKQCGKDLTKGGVEFDLPETLDEGRPVLFSGGYHEQIAKALEYHLRHSGTFSYSLEIRRDNESIDPALDFLKNTRAGHCELFASSLVLMLRSVGIPARMVTGYKGAEIDEDQIYYVRQRHAHAWAEVLLPRLDRQGNHIQVPTFGHLWDWMTLDPTPDGLIDAEGETISDAVAKWFQESQEAGERLWRVLFIDYNAEAAIEQMVNIWQRGPLRRALVTFVASVLVVGAILGFLAIRLFLRSRKENLALLQREHPWLSLTRLVGQKGMHPAPGQTPREFALEISHRFETQPQLKDWVGLPLELVGEYHQVRFGDQPETSGMEEQKAQILELGKTIKQLQPTMGTWTSPIGKSS